MKCPKCRVESEGCVYCPECGYQLMYDQYQPQPRRESAPPPQYQPQTPPPYYAGGQQYTTVTSHKSRLAALLLAIFFGYFGVHRFYAGKIGTGILWALTGGFFLIGYIVDIILLACGVFKDGNGMPIIRW